MPVGVWYHYSYGTIAMYKRDWESFGGFQKNSSTKTHEVVRSGIQGRTRNRTQACAMDVSLPTHESGNVAKKLDDLLLFLF